MIRRSLLGFLFVFLLLQLQLCILLICPCFQQSKPFHLFYFELSLYIDHSYGWIYPVLQNCSVSSEDNKSAFFFMMYFIFIIHEVTKNCFSFVGLVLFTYLSELTSLDYSDFCFIFSHFLIFFYQMFYCFNHSLPSYFITSLWLYTLSFV